MIKSFRHKGLRELFETGASAKVRPDLRIRCQRRIDALKQAKQLLDMNVPGFNFHKLRGSPERYSVHVNGPWCITFGWDNDGPVDVDLEQYH